MRFSREASAALGALALLCVAAAPAPRRTPAPAPTPLKVIRHVYSYGRLCTGLRRSIAPAIARMMAVDRTIAYSRPLFRSFAKDQSTGSEAARDMDVERLDQTIDPLVKNTQQIESLLNDPLYMQRPVDPQDQQLAKIRAYLAAVLEEQKRALDLVSGFVDTENLGELQAKGHEYDRALLGTGTTNSADPYSKPQSASPTSSPAPILNAGLSHKNDPGYQNDPRYKNSDSSVGYNPLNVFDRQMGSYQKTIDKFESLASHAIIQAVPNCGGRVQATPPPSPKP